MPRVLHHTQMPLARQQQNSRRAQVRQPYDVTEVVAAVMLIFGLGLIAYAIVDGNTSMPQVNPPHVTTTSAASYD